MSRGLTLAEILAYIFTLALFIALLLVFLKVMQMFIDVAKCCWWGTCPCPIQPYFTHYLNIPTSQS